MVTQESTKIFKIIENINLPVFRRQWGRWKDRTAVLQPSPGWRNIKTASAILCHSITSAHFVLFLSCLLSCNQYSSIKQVLRKTSVCLYFKEKIRVSSKIHEVLRNITNPHPANQHWQFLACKCTPIATVKVKRTVSSVGINQCNPTKVKF